MNNAYRWGDCLLPVILHGLAQGHSRQTITSEARDQIDLWGAGGEDEILGACYLEGALDAAESLGAFRSTHSHERRAV